MSSKELMMRETLLLLKYTVLQPLILRKCSITYRETLDSTLEPPINVNLSIHGLPKNLEILTRAHEVGVRVPRPIIAKNNVLVMEFIGDEDGNPAQLMRQSKISNPEYVTK